jgi:hypothetical protein
MVLPGDEPPAQQQQQPQQQLPLPPHAAIFKALDDAFGPKLRHIFMDYLFSRLPPGEQVVPCPYDVRQQMYEDLKTLLRIFRRPIPELPPDQPDP